jgi:HEAT repeat protein
MRVAVRIAVAAVLGLSILSATVMAQSLAARLDEASAARQAGQLDKALTMAHAAAVAHPTDTNVARLEIEILLDQSKRDAALAAYDRYVSARRSPDRVLLSLIATNELRRVAAAPEPEIAIPALERLAQTGDVASRQALVDRATRQPISLESLGLMTSLSRLGDARAQASIGQLLLSVPLDQRRTVLEAIRDGKARTQAQAVADLLSDLDPLVRLAAAQTLGVLLEPKTIPQLEATLASDPVPSVKLFAAVALKRLGRPSGDELAARLLASDVPEMRLLGGQAYAFSKTRQWTSRILELGAGRNEMHHVQAAEVLACCDAPGARTLLAGALRSPNPLLRREAARVLETTQVADMALARTLLGDPDETVRVYGAGALLTLPQTAQPAAAPRAR